MKFIVHTDFTATYRWEGEAANKDEAGEKAYAAVADMDASELWSKLYGYGNKIELVEAEEPVAEK
jgi:hypothetical protein